MLNRNLPRIATLSLLWTLAAVGARAQTITVANTDLGPTNSFTWGVNAPDKWNPWVGDANFKNAISNAGIKLVRVNPIAKCLEAGQDISSAPGTYNWTHLDSLLNTIYDAGAQPLFVVCDFPGAVTRSMSGSTVVSANWSQYATVMQAVVNRYNVTKALGPTKTIKYWELWNEPTVEPSGILGDPPTGLYQGFAQTVGNAMKTADPTIKLIGPVDSWSNLGSGGYLNWAAQNLSSQIDILSWHNYGPGSSDLDRMNWTPGAYKTDPTTVRAGGSGLFVGPGGKYYGTAITEYNLCGYDFGSAVKFTNEYGSTYVGSAVINAILGNLDLFTLYAAAETGANVLGLLQNTNYAVKAKSYYVLQLFGTQFVKGDRKLGVTGGSSTLEATAAFSSITGKRYVALVNKDLAASQTVTVSLSGVGSSGGSRTVWLVDATNNATSATASYSGSSFSYTIGPRSFAMIEVSPAIFGSNLFTSGLETGDTQPTYLDSVLASSNVGPYTVGGVPECSPREVIADGWGLTAHAGTKAIMYSGNDTSATTSYCNFRVFNVSIPVTAATKLRYWLCPQTANGRYVGVDFICSDGSTLRDSGATDANGFSMHPNAGHGGSIPLNTWTQIKCNVGTWLAGKTIIQILINYDRPATTGQFRGYLDDILITNGTLP